MKESEHSVLPWISGEFDISGLIRAEIHVLNSAQIRDDIAREIERAGKSLTPRFIVILMDIAKWRAKAGTDGSRSWDETVKAIGDRIGPVLSPRDAFATLSEGRIVLLADTSGHYGKPDEFAQDIQLELASGIMVSGEEIIFPSSAGIAWVTAGCVSPDVVLSNATIALGRARADGPGHAIIFHDWMRDLEIISTETVSEQVQS